MSGFADVQECAMTAWAAVPLAYPVAKEGRDFSPPSDAAWAALFTLPVSTRAAAVGAGSPLEHLILLQVDLHQPLNTGTAQLLADADVVATAFDPGATFTHNGIRLMSERCERSSIRRASDDASNVLSVTIRMRGWQHRSTP